jgi:hypothetical protein
MGQLSNVVIGLICGAFFGALSGGAALWLFVRLFSRGVVGLGMGVVDEARLGLVLGALFGLLPGAVVGALTLSLKIGGATGALIGASFGLILAAVALAAGGRATDVLKLAALVVPLGAVIGYAARFLICLVFRSCA